MLFLFVLNIIVVVLVKGIFFLVYFKEEMFFGLYLVLYFEVV